MESKVDYSKYTYYALVGVLSLVSLLFLPMLGTDIGVEVSYPSTGLEWATWGITKGIVAVVNMMLFHCFHQQGKVKARDNPRFIEAWEKDFNNPHKSYIARSPHKWNGQQYGKKGTTLVVSSILSAFVLTNAVLKYDWVALISYAITLTMGVVFGVMQMSANYAYWTEEYPVWVNQQLTKGESNK